MAGGWFGNGARPIRSGNNGSPGGGGPRSQDWEQRVSDTAARDTEGLRIERIGETEFREFTRRHGTSPEIGPIGTYLDDDHRDRAYGEPHLFALTGCGDTCAVVCCTLGADRTGETHACKLDSIIVHQSIRRGGLGATLVGKAFQELLADPRFNITTLFSYAVHPATVRMLCGFGFSKPAPTGAPLSSLDITADSRQLLDKELRIRFQNAERKLKLQCTYCLNNNRRARPWCAHRLART